MAPDRHRNWSALPHSLGARAARYGLPALALCVAVAIVLPSYGSWGEADAQRAKAHEDLETLRPKAAVLDDVSRAVERLRTEAYPVGGGNAGAGAWLIGRVVDAGDVDLIDFHGADGETQDSAAISSLTLRGDLVELSGFLEALAEDPPAVVLDGVVMRGVPGSPAAELTLSRARERARRAEAPRRSPDLSDCSTADTRLRAPAPRVAPARRDQPSLVGFARMGGRAAALVRDGFGRVRVVARAVSDPPRAE